MRMQEEDKKDKIKCTVLAWNLNVLFNQIQIKLNIITNLKLKTEIQTDQAMEYNLIKNQEDKIYKTK